MLARQLDLLGGTALGFDPSMTNAERIVLGQGAWIERVPNWLRGQDTLFERLEKTTRWQARKRVMYEREVDVPRLVAAIPDDGPGDPILVDLERTLARRHGTRLPHVLLALYRDGRDSVAWHGDRVGRLQPDTVVAIVSVGGPRPFLLRRRGGGPSRRFTVGLGDLLVMGGTCQSTWEHCVPKVAHAQPRIAIMFRQAY
jgi:alkylated DNA repair dioxygenase AlkB